MPSEGRTVTVAFVFPLALAAAFLGVFLAHADVSSLVDGGALWFAALLALALGSAAAASALAGLGVARPAAFACAILPWLAGDAAMHLALRDAAILAATSAGPPADVVRSFIAGFGAALASRDVGALAAASIALGLAVSFLFRTRRDGFAAIVAPAALAFALTALALPAHGGAHHVRHALAILAGDADQGRAALADALAHAAEAQRGLDEIALAALAVAVVTLAIAALKRNRRAVVEALACGGFVALAFFVDVAVASAPIAKLAATVLGSTSSAASHTPVDAGPSTRDNAP